MSALGKDTGLLPVTEAEAKAMDSFRRKLLIPLITITPSNTKENPKILEKRDSAEAIDTILPEYKKERKKRITTVQPSYVDVTGIKPPEFYAKDGARIPCEPIKIYEGATIKDALDNLLNDIRTKA